MKNFIMFCKTYSKDFKQFEYMIETFNRYNREDISMVVSVPKQEMNLYKNFKNKNIELICDEDYANDYFVKDWSGGLSVGYINQQICKLSFWETNRSENYFCVDSDAVFIRDFYYDDFMFNEKIPYTVLIMDKDLSIEKNYHNFWLLRQEFIQKIYDYCELKDKRLRTCHGFQIMNYFVLQSLKNDFMNKHKYSYSDLLRIAPFEFSWYNVWFQKSKIIPEISIEPLFKVFHTKIDYNINKIKQLTIEDYKYSYVGVVYNSNWLKGLKCKKVIGEATIERLNKITFLSKVIYRYVIRKLLL